MKKNLKSGFSLLELMFLLVIVSCVLAAFAPIFTRRLMSEEYTSFADQNLKTVKTDCTAEYNVHCLMCETGRRCIVCDLGCPAGKTLDVDKCVCK